jgi:hypothetical protein
MTVLSVKTERKWEMDRNQFDLRATPVGASVCVESGRDSTLPNNKCKYFLARKRAES